MGSRCSARTAVGRRSAVGGPMGKARQRPARLATPAGTQPAMEGCAAARPDQRGREFDRARRGESPHSAASAGSSGNRPLAVRRSLSPLWHMAPLPRPALPTFPVIRHAHPRLMRPLDHCVGRQNVMRSRPCIAALFSVGLAAGQPDRPGLQVMVTDSSGVRITITEGAERTFAEVDPQPIVSLGGADAEGPAQFFDIRGIHVDSRGYLWVADGGSAEVRIFRSDGSHWKTVGGRGEGPGEFRRIRILGAVPGRQRGPLG